MHLHHRWPTAVLLVIPILVLAAACDWVGDTGPDAARAIFDGSVAASPDAAMPRDAAVAAPPDAAYQCVVRDTGWPEAWASLCADLVAGESALAWRSATECGAPLRPEDMPHLPTATVDSCEPGSRRERDLRRVAASVAAGRAKLDPAMQEACRSLGRGSDAGTPFDDAGRILEPCRSVLVGLVAPGGACDYDEECAPGHWCSLATAGSCGGTCVAALAEGSSCRSLSDPCAEGTYCLPDLSSDAGTSSCQRIPGLGQPCSDYCLEGRCTGGTCVEVPPAKEGEPCQGDGCEQGLSCVGASDAGAGTCRPLAQEGQACGAGEPACAPCLSCSTVSGTCLKRAEPGDPCAPDAGSPSLFSNYYCGAGGILALKPRTGEPCTRASSCLYTDDFCSFATSSDGEGVCKREPGLCEPCGARSDLSPSCRQGRCVVDLGEVAGVCAPLSGEGEACDLVSCQAGLVCETGVCRGLPSTPGADCSRPGSCGPGLRCAGAEVDGGPRLCVAQRPAGERCTVNDECLSGTCSEGTCAAGACSSNQLAKGCWTGSAFEYFGYLIFFAAVVRRRRR